MRVLYGKGVPHYHIKKFRAVRSSEDNLHNILNIIEAVEIYPGLISENYCHDFDFCLFLGGVTRALVRKEDGLFSMSIPFQVVDEGERFFFNDNFLKEKVDGKLISILRNAIEVVRTDGKMHEDVILSISESFSLELHEATRYCDAFFVAISEDSGYFRFDDDPDNEDGDIHPRLHFDFFYSRSGSIKMGIDASPDFETLCSLFLPGENRPYLIKKPK